MGHLLDRWYENASQDFSPKTALEVRGFIDRNLMPALGTVQLGKLRTEELDRYYSELRRRGGHSGNALAPATVRRIHGILHRALGQAVRWGWIRQNPASAVQLPRVPVGEINPPAPADVARLFQLAAAENPDLAMFVLLAAATGARRSELVALRWSDLDLHAKRVSISRGLVFGPDGIVEKDTKSHAARRISLDPITIDGLRAHHERATERATACDATLDLHAFVFSHDADASTPWRPDSTTRAFTRLRGRAGLEHIRLHDLRHYVATRLLSAGVDVRTVAGRLGHRNSATTLNVYAHFLAEADEDAAGVLGKLFDNAANKRTAMASDGSDSYAAKAVEAQ